MVKDLFCNNCDDYREFDVINRREVYVVKDTEIEIDAKVSICKICGAELFNEVLDEENFEKAYSIYRRNQGLLSPIEIKAIREMYGLSQRGFSKILRWSDVTMNRYEMGAIPDRPHNNTLLLLKKPTNMEEILDNNPNVLSESKDMKLRDKIKNLIDEQSEEYLKKSVLDTLNKNLDIFSGFKNFDFEKFRDLVVFFASNTDKLFKTKLMKLLWYTDFEFFRENTLSLTGLQYARLPRGPVVEKRNLLLGLLEQQNVISLIEDYETNGEFILVNECYSNLSLNDGELKVAQRVLDKFKNFNCKQISDYSHEEKGWIDNSNGSLISYEYANSINLN